MKLIKIFGLIFLIGNLFGCYSQKTAETASGNTQPESIKQSNQIAQNFYKTNANKTPVNENLTFKKNTDYQKIVREKLLKDGWKPARSEKDGQENCVSNSKICQDFPELEAGPSSPLGEAIFRWEKDDKVLLIYALDTPLIFNRLEYEKTAKHSKVIDIIGKYFHADTSEVGGEFTLELADKNKVKLDVLEEDASTKGVGFWEFDNKRGILKVTMNVKVTLAGSDEKEIPENTKVVFQFRKIGNNLKLVNSTNYKHLIGSTFKKI